jgi:hypothetical protein
MGRSLHAQRHRTGWTKCGAPLPCSDELHDDTVICSTRQRRTSKPRRRCWWRSERWKPRTSRTPSLAAGAAESVWSGLLLASHLRGESSTPLQGPGLVTGTDHRFEGGPAGATPTAPATARKTRAFDGPGSVASTITLLLTRNRRGDLPAPHQGRPIWHCRPGHRSGRGR